MGAVGGDILEVAYSGFNTKGVSYTGGIFFPKAGEDSNLDLGGFRNEDDQKMVDGGGNQIRQLTQNLWMADFTIANDVNVRNDLDKLTKLAGSSSDVTWTITHINGAVYRGIGSLVGEVAANFTNATIKIKIAGGGQLKKIAG